jgi:hypothetical protein
LCIPHTRCTVILSDDTTMTQDKVTIQEAARTLNIDRRKIYRWIEKGLIPKYTENDKTFVLLEEVRAFCAEHTTEHAQECAAHNKSTDTRTEISTTERTHYIVDKEHYEGLLIRLGQMESEKKYLLEYKQDLDRRDKELAETKSTLAKANSELRKMVDIKKETEQKEKEIASLQAEVERLRLPWWKKLFQREKS